MGVCVVFGSLLLMWGTCWATGNQAEVTILCKTVVWLGHPNEPKGRVERCWNLTAGVNWYGGGSQQSTLWPIQSQVHMMIPAVTGAKDSSTNSIHSRFWMNSAGLAIIADGDVPLFVDSNDFLSKDLFCLEAFNGYPYHYPENAPLKLSYSLCEAPQENTFNLTDFYLSLRRTFFRLPVDIPDESLFRLPLWATYPKFLRPSSSDILSYAANISNFVGLLKSNVFRKGLIHIHDWQLCEGGLQFVSSKIQDPQSLFVKLTSLGFGFALQIHPFVKEQCSSFEEAHKHGYLVQDKKTGKPALVNWMGQSTYVIDFTNEKAAEWWSAKLQVLQAKYKISSFVFDGGVSSVFQHGYILSSEPTLHPDVFTTRYAEAAAAFGPLGIIASAWQTQHLPNFVRANRLFSTGTSDADSLNGAIPNVLLIGLLGYPFVMPEIIGGSYGNDAQPDEIVYIRWLQLSTFLPAIHFSYGPWEYGPAVMNIALDMLQRRAKFEDYLVAVARQATVDGSPIIRPLWWSSPNDETAQIIADQFLVGDKLLVAPVMDTSKGQCERDIYLPDGRWKDENNLLMIYEGRKWLRNYNVSLHQLPYFTRV